jgi:hypothetical protein
MSARVRDAAIVGGGLVAAVALRVWILSGDLGRAESDESVVGLMALAIRDGARPYMFFGQNYGGTLEPAITGMVFKVVDPSSLTLKLVPVVLAAVCAVLVWRIGRRIVSEQAARVAGALFLLFPPLFVWWSTKARGFYWVQTALVLGVLLVGLRVLERVERGDRARLELGALGLLAGLAWWTSPQTTFVLLAFGAWLAYRARAAWRDWWFVVVGFALGALPWLRWNIAHDWASFDTPPVPESTYFDRIEQFFTRMLPQMLGLRLIFSGDWRGGPIGALIYCALLAAFGAALVWWWRHRTEHPAVEPLLAIAVVYPFVYAIAPTSYHPGDPRYLLLLAPIVVLLVAVVLTTWWRQLAILGFAVILSVVSTNNIEDQANELGLVDVVPRDVDPLVEKLDELDVDFAYADYWAAYVLTYATDRAILATPVDNVRDSAIDVAVAGVYPSTYVLFRGSPRDAGLPAALEADGVGYERYEAGGYAVYVLDRNYIPSKFPPGYWATH